MNSGLRFQHHLHLFLTNAPPVADTSSPECVAAFCIFSTDLPVSPSSPLCHHLCPGMTLLLTHRFLLRPCQGPEQHGRWKRAALTRVGVSQRRENRGDDCWMHVIAQR